jgi:4-diphosphocytidyl-2-C-methyl-D-erythritol kinase
VVIFSNCKINLGLHVIEKRPDGFHNVETCFYPIPFYDVIEIIPATAFQFTTTGLAIPGDVTNNLCVKAYQLLKSEYGIPYVHLHLQKNIPMGAGIGGGSANAAYTLLLLNKKFQLNLPIELLENYAAQLGSDCAFFIRNIPCLGSGRGELLQPIKTETDTDFSLKDYQIVLLFPNIAIGTKEAFAGIIPRMPKQGIANIIKLPITAWKDCLQNDFESTVFALHPVLQQYKNSLYQLGAIYASMSGSGSTIYGIFSKEIELEETIQAAFPQLGYKIVSG